MQQFMVLQYISVFGGKQVADRQAQYKRINNSATYG